MSEIAKSAAGFVCAMAVHAVTLAALTGTAALIALAAGVSVAAAATFVAIAGATSFLVATPINLISAAVLYKYPLAQQCVRLISTGIGVVAGIGVAAASTAALGMAITALTGTAIWIASTLLFGAAVCAVVIPVVVVICVVGGIAAAATGHFPGQNRSLASTF